jgi:hypothetical protein
LLGGKRSPLTRGDEFSAKLKRKRDYILGVIHDKN